MCTLSSGVGPSHCFQRRGVSSSRTLGVIREQLRAIVGQRRAGDPHLHYVDGLELYGANDNLRLPLPDELHPDAASHRLIGERFAGLLPDLLR